jgi:hypothetical protein
MHPFTPPITKGVGDFSEIERLTRPDLGMRR